MLKNYFKPTLRNLQGNKIYSAINIVTIALLIAMPVAWLICNQWLENYPYRIAMDWKIFAATGFLVVALSLITVSFQALRAAGSNPVNAIRNE